jgi:hypothetical protein
MPTSITILDWGKPGMPMIAQQDVATLRLEIPDRPTAWHDIAIAYATRELAAPLDVRPGLKAVHLGFYG